ncbi:MAG: family 20 glycosylhydrolase [Candidatus Omnitrophica bacterium]|nr:family 20 glycosylhydrolase [Candidatus Omnitrophota bacterium]
MEKAPWVCGKAAFENRVVHIDLKGPKIPFDSFKKFLEKLARWGINGVLVEYEHRFPFLPLKNQFPISERYSRNQMNELIKFACDHGIEWIPLVQTFGHVEYLSRLEGTQVLFENPEYPQQLCPMKTQTRKYLEDLLDIICTFHQNTRYIHVGQDETHQLGYCAQCKKEVKKIGKIEFYLLHVQWVWDIVRKYNKIPLFWADMFFTENRIDLLKKVDHAIPVVWEYDDTDEISHDIRIGSPKPSILDARNPYKAPEKGLPVSRFEKDGNFFEDMDEKIKNMIGTDKKTGYPKSFPQTRIVSQINKNFWSACATYNCSDKQFLPDFIRALLNPIFMCKTLKEVGGRSIIATNWARAHSWAPISPPWTLYLYNIAHFAAFCYTGTTKPSDIKETSKIIAREISMPVNFGKFSLDDILWVISSNAPGPGIMKRIRNLENTLLLLKQQKIKSKFGNGLLIGVEAELLWSKLIFLQEEARWWTPMKGQIPSIIFEEMEERFTHITKEIKKLEIRAYTYYTETVGDSRSFKTWWKGLFDLDLSITEKAIKSLTK